MSRWSIDPPDDAAYDVRYDGTACDDCGRPAEAWLCESCSDQREAWAAAAELRIAALVNGTPAAMHENAAFVHNVNNIPVVDVALVPIEEHPFGPVVEVALVPTGLVEVSGTAARDLKRMARAFLSADLSHVKDVA